MDEQNKLKAFNRIMISLHPTTAEIFNGDAGFRSHFLELLKDQKGSILSSIPEPDGEIRIP